MMWRGRRPAPCSTCWRQDMPVTAISHSLSFARHQREELLPSYGHGDIVVLLLEAKGAGHAAAAGISLLDLVVCGKAQDVYGRPCAHQGLLVAVAME